jgi:hypothetical protein
MPMVPLTLGGGVLSYNFLWESQTSGTKYEAKLEPGYDSGVIPSMIPSFFGTQWYRVQILCLRS